MPAQNAPLPQPDARQEIPETFHRLMDTVTDKGYDGCDLTCSTSSVCAKPPAWNCRNCNNQVCVEGKKPPPKSLPPPPPEKPSCEPWCNPW
eukprot:CAMPEP_0119302522 /NCGR_PEP_ID=MMETSP1333-20130426/4107_1 /TAXON_ID=418940 /ORGANISM="Scyphosphaera apsteinii, Strain RCC1455" /LENGTH=90 /DNA_ID=CAMNT_0007304901 /DNA_START=24 /DNA_END=293 /DNA_ORIENTATION=+